MTLHCRVQKSDFTEIRLKTRVKQVRSLIINYNVQ